MDLFDLSGEVAVVIGATGTLGGAIAEGLAGAGAKVAVLGRNEARGEECAKRIRGLGGEARFFSADAMSRESLGQARTGIEKAFGPSSILVNAAGGNDPKVLVSAAIPLSRAIAYSAAKAAVINLTQFLAREWAAKNVRVNAITPGFFPAEQNRLMLFNEDGTPTERAGLILGHTPMGRFGKPEELAGAVIFLASAKASGFVTGVELRVDGGFLAQTI